MLRRGLHRPRRSTSGFTLLELLIVLAILGIVGTSVVAGVRAFTRSELRGSASRLAGAIRYLFDRASTTGKVHRLVFEFETGKYWAEVSDDRFFLPRERETEESRFKDVEAQQQEAEEAKEREKAAESAATDQGYDYTKYQPTDWKPKRAHFDMFEEKALKVTALKGAKLAGLFTPRYAAPIATGHGYLYFFPLGQTEPAIVHVSDPDGQIFYSLMIHPLNGRVKVVAGYVEPRVEEQFDDEGKRLEEP